MKTKATMTGKRHKEGIACIMAAILLLASYPVAEAAEPVPERENAAEYTVEDFVLGEDAMEEAPEDADAVQEPETQENGILETTDKVDISLDETVSENSISENSLSENSTEEETAAEADGLTENGTESEDGALTVDEEESVSENTVEESVSENTTEEESVSENTVEESASENSTEEESVSENTVGESVSENTAQASVSANTMGVGSMAAADTDAASAPPKPVIKSVVPKDTTAEIRFTHLLEDAQAAQIRYEVLVRDEVKGVDLPLQAQNPSGAGDSVLTIAGYDGKALNTFRISGLAANKKYAVVLRAKYGEDGTPVASDKKTFTTKKDMIATDGTMKVRYADMEALKSDRTKKPEEMPETGVQMRIGEQCALYAQVSRLMRAVETDKLRWAAAPADADTPKNGLKVQASKSTYEAVLTAVKPGSYRVTATNTLSRETVSTFQVTIAAAE